MRLFGEYSSADSWANQLKHYKTASPSVTLTTTAAHSHAFPRTPSSNSKSTATTSPVRTIKAATVTMMLAERIVRNDWSVEDEHFFESNHMSVWQTLEFLSHLNARKRYYYEGYSDRSNALRTLTPSWRCDSFIEKNVNPNGGESKSMANGKYSAVAGGGNLQANNNKNRVNGGVKGNGVLRAGAGGHRNGADGQSSKSSRRQRAKQNLELNELEAEYALSPSDYADLIKCTFNLPRISAALERLMGTNVVRLTDRNYMKELRERIEDDYRTNLLKRIKAREQKEIERERVLISEGKTNVIPAELAEDPIFMVDKKAELEISKTRAKLKTNREKNSERLKLQGVKWERERLLHEEEEAERIKIVNERCREQKDLEEKYKIEDANRGMDLLRIHNEDWRPCEQQLKDFLEQERAKMKERSQQVPTAFATDPKDITNILKARKEFRLIERRIRKAIEEQHQEKLQQKPVQQQQSGQTILGTSQSLLQSAHTESQTTRDFYEAFGLETTFEKQNLSHEEESDISSDESLNADDSSTSLDKQRYVDMLQRELENDVAEGRVISKDQYDHLRYEDDKIMQLRNAKDIRELYQLAEEIIIGERLDVLAEEPEAVPQVDEEQEPEMEEEDE